MFAAASDSESNANWIPDGARAGARAKLSECLCFRTSRDELTPGGRPGWKSAEEEVIDFGKAVDCVENSLCGSQSGKRGGGGGGLFADGGGGI